MSKADELNATLSNAKERIAKIGKPESYSPTVGYLYLVSLTTVIHHQARPGDTNYWSDDAFDKALASVVKSNFAELSAAAIALMQHEANAALLNEEGRLRTRLAAIEAIKAGAQS